MNSAKNWKPEPDSSFPLQELRAVSKSNRPSPSGRLWSFPPVSGRAGWWLLSVVPALRGLSSWWLLAPNTPRQDHRPCTHRRNLKFRLPVFFRHLPGKGQTKWFALCTPCSFFPMQPFSADKGKGKTFADDPALFFCLNVVTPKRMRGSRGKTFGWPPGRQVSKHLQEQKFNFCDGCRAGGPAEGCWGREATN